MSEGIPYGFVIFLKGNNSVFSDDWIDIDHLDDRGVPENKCEKRITESWEWWQTNLKGQE